VYCLAFPVSIKDQLLPFPPSDQGGHARLLLPPRLPLPSPSLSPQPRLRSHPITRDLIPHPSRPTHYYRQHREPRNPPPSPSPSTSSSPQSQTRRLRSSAEVRTPLEPMVGRSVSPSRNLDEDRMRQLRRSPQLFVRREVESSSSSISTFRHSRSHPDSLLPQHPTSSRTGFYRSTGEDPRHHKSRTRPRWRDCSCRRVGGGKVGDGGSSSEVVNGGTEEEV